MRRGITSGSTGSPGNPAPGEPQRVLCLRRANPAQRDWSRRACGSQLSREPVRLKGIHHENHTNSHTIILLFKSLRSILFL
jgi:hypothetical protein